VTGKIVIMTTSKKAKRVARERSAVTGERYVEARRRLSKRPSQSGSELFIDDHCANCFDPLPEEADGLFCGEWCKETAGSVRYIRKVFRDERRDDPLVQQAIQKRLAFLPVGGYQGLGRRLSASTRAEVVERDHGVCQSCGKPANQVDHIAGSSGSLDNLQLLCDECHHEKTVANFVPAPVEVQAMIAELLLTRVYPDAPSRLADDEAAWDGAWRGLKTARRQRLVDETVGMGIDVVGLKTRAELLEVRDDRISDLDEREVERMEWNENFLDEGPWDPDAIRWG
jgi:hypothetical protein